MASSPSRVVAILELIGVAVGVGVIPKSDDGYRCIRASNGALNHLRRVVVSVVVTRSYVSSPDQGCLWGYLRSCRFRSRSSYHKQAYGKGHRCCCCACEHNAHRVLNRVATHEHNPEYVFSLRATWGRLLPRRERGSSAPPHQLTPSS